MAILKNLLVNGASRFIGKTYFADVDISGVASLASLSLSGNLSVTGTSTLTGNTTVGGTLGVTGNASFGNITATGTVVFSKTTDLSGTANNSPALIVGGTATSAHMELDANEIHAKATGTTVAPLYINNQGGNVYLSGNSVYASGSAFNTNTLRVADTFWAHDFEFEIQHVVDGIMRISPTLRFPAKFDGETSTTTAMSCTKSGSTLTITITDSSITTSAMAGIVWSSGSRVKVSGKIGGIATETMSGTISSISNGTLSVQVTGGNIANISATSTLSDFDDITVMVYERKDGNNYYPTGILINCYDASNKSATIKVYGGTSATPNVTVGNLVGLSFNGSALPSTSPLWGIHTSMGYFEGAVVSTEGQIGGFTIGDTTLKNGDLGGTTSVVMSTGTSSSTAIGGSSGSKTWAFAASNKFGVTTSGELFATSGKIANWTIKDTYLATGTATAPAANSLILSPAGTTSSYTVAGTAKSGWMITAGTTFGVNKDGGVYATSGKIGGWSIGISSLYSGTHSAYNSNVDGIFMDSTYLAGGKQAMWYLKNDGSAKIGALTLSSAGVLAVPAANITGTLSADHIDASSLQIGQTQVTGLSTALDNKADNSTVTALSNKVAAVYGTSNPGSTNASEQVKVVTCSNFELFSGALITVKFTYANAYASGAVQLNVNSKGAKNIWVANAVTSSTNKLLWGAGAVITFRYDGSAFIVVGEPREWYGTCSTAARTSGKVSTDVAGCVICKGVVVSLSMTNDNTATSPSLNIVYTGSINLYAGNGTTRPTTDNGLGWTAGSTVPFVFDGQYWRVGDTASLSRASDAAKTATNYISTIGNTGIKVSYATNSTNYLQITADGTSIYKNSVQVANYGDSIVLGELASGVTHVEIDSDSFDVCVGTGTGNNATKIATFGENVIIGKENDSRISMTNSSFGFLNSSNDSIFQINDQSISLGKQSDGQFIIQSDRMNLYDSEANSVFSVQKGGGGTTTLNSYAVFNQKVTQTRLNIGDEGEDLTDQTVSNFVLKTFRAPSGSSTYVQQLYYTQVPYCTPITEITIPSNYYTISNMEYTDLHTSFTLQFTQEGANYIHGIIDNDCDPNMMRYAIFYDYTYNPPSYSVLTMNGNINADEIIAETSVTSGDFIFNSTFQPINEIQADFKNVTVTSTNKIDQKPTIGAQLTLYWGTYLLLAHGDFNSGSSSGARIIQLAIYTGINPVNTDVINASRVRVVNAAAYWSGLTTYAIVTVPYGTANTFTVGLTSSIAQSSTSSTSLQAILLRPVEPT